jgi:hypothetical protein
MGTKALAVSLLGAKNAVRCRVLAGSEIIMCEGKM